MLTAHVVVDDSGNGDRHLQLKTDLADVLAQFELQHTTIEIELSRENCRDDDYQTSRT